MARKSVLFSSITFALIIGTVTMGFAETRVFNASKDNTLFNVPDGSLSNGAGTHMHTGRSNSGVIRRAVLAFDVSSIPADSTIESVQLRLHMSRTKNGVPRTTSLHRLLQDWGEAGSFADRGQGGGAPAQPGDATWLHTYFPNQSWTTPGGTYAGDPSAATDVGDVGHYTWISTAGFVADVQSWVDNPTSNFGWILIGDEISGGSTSKRFDSRSNPDVGTRPELTVVFTSDQFPAPSFEWSPDRPTVGQEIQFTDTSTGNPTSWMWDFGDGATSTDQHPSHSYSSTGGYTVTLTATNAYGSGIASRLIPVSEGGPNLTEMTFIAAAANAPGVGSSFFVTDVDVNNAGTTILTYQFLWLPRNSDNELPVRSETFSLEAGEAVRHDNILESVFGLEGVAGALAIASDSTSIRVMSRTFNQSTDGTFGQSFAGVPATALTPANQRVRVLFMTENGDFRSNLGLLNGVDSPTTIRWELFDPDGTSLEIGEMNLDAWSTSQLNRVFANFAPIEAAYVDVWTETPGAFFSCYGSVLDAVTSDPTTILPQ